MADGATRPASDRGWGFPLRSTPVPLEGADFARCVAAAASGAGPTVLTTVKRDPKGRGVLHPVAVILSVEDFRRLKPANGGS